MAFAMLAEIADLTREQYESVVKKINETGTPVGALVHAAGPVEGGYRVIEIWQTREAADAFYTSQRYRAATADITSQPNILMTWPVEGIDTGAGWHGL
jgi:quinol monooxygenase YgiN